MREPHLDEAPAASGVALVGGAAQVAGGVVRPPAAAPASRQVWCEDALSWLSRNAPLEGCSLVTSLPDVSGLPALDFAGWRRWFIGAAELVLAATADMG